MFYFKTIVHEHKFLITRTNLAFKNNPKITENIVTFVQYTVNSRK